MEFESSIPCSQELATGPYPEPLENVPHSRSMLLLSFHLCLRRPNNVFPSGFPSKI